MPIYQQTIDCPFGEAYLYADQQQLHALLFTPWQSEQAAKAINKSNPIIAACKQQLNQYFTGQRTSFDVPLATNGTEFQCKVWQTLLEIPFAETWNYGQLATAIGNKNASRAVGMANSKNPISIIVPCHRVIGANGNLTGYAGGLKAKQWLLEHEKSIASKTLDDESYAK